VLLLLLLLVLALLLPVQQRCQAAQGTAAAQGLHCEGLRALLLLLLLLLLGQAHPRWVGPAGRWGTAGPLVAA
jgi:hypothetical protein